MNANRDSLAGERLLGGELPLELIQDGHVAPHPFDSALPFGGELGCGDDVFLHHEGLVVPFYEKTSSDLSKTQSLRIAILLD